VNPSTQQADLRVNRPTSTVVRTRSGEVQRSSNGEVRGVRGRGIEIHRAPGGASTVTLQRRDHSTVVTNRAGHGYVQRPYTFHNQQFVTRTYHVRNAQYVRVYRPFVYRGMTLHVYVPARYYAPALYSWAYTPWTTPVVFRWGWIDSPWYAQYQGYFVPSPRYVSPALWLADYMMAATLQQAYQERQDAAERLNADDNGNAAPMSADVKDAIADEVRRQLALENFERQTASEAAPDPGSSGIARMLGDHESHVFVVARPLAVNSDLGECALTEGDVLQLTGSQPNDGTIANLTVLAKRGQGCRSASRVAVQLDDLQEMQNHMRETVGQGLAELQAKQGQGDVPAMPSAATQAATQAAYAPIAPPDPNLAKDLKESAHEAEKVEKEILGQLSRSGS